MNNYLTKKSGLLHLSAVFERTGRIKKEILRYRLHCQISRKCCRCSASRKVSEMRQRKMELVSSQKLEAVANYIGEKEMYGDCVCYNFNDSLEKNRIDVPCDIGSCEGNCPFYSKENFIKWIKKTRQ